jgi:DNA replication protein DnaC
MDFHKVHDLCTAHFVRAKFNVALLGLLGDGKTSLALAAGRGGLRGWVFNLRHGFDELVHRLRTAETGRHYDQQLQAYLRPAVLIVDDFGSQAIDQTAVSWFSKPFRANTIVARRSSRAQKASPTGATYSATSHGHRHPRPASTAL